MPSYFAFLNEIIFQNALRVHNKVPEVFLGHKELNAFIGAVLSVGVADALITDLMLLLYIGREFDESLDERSFFRLGGSCLVVYTLLDWFPQAGWITCGQVLMQGLVLISVKSYMPLP